MGSKTCLSLQQRGPVFHLTPWWAQQHMHRPAPGTKPGSGGRWPCLGWGSGFKSTTLCTKGSAASTTMWPSSLNHGSRERRSLGSKQDQAGATDIHSQTPTHAPPPPKKKPQQNNKKHPRGFHYSSRDKQGTYQQATTRLHSTPEEQATMLCSHRLATKAEATRGDRQLVRTITPQNQRYRLMGLCL